VVVLGISLGGGACSRGYTPSALERWPEDPSCGSYENRNEPVSSEHVCDSVEEDSGFLYGVDCRAISVDEIVS
jgi:hypothetical protein